MLLKRSGQRFALTAQGCLIYWGQVAEFDTAAEALGVADHGVNSQSLVRFGNRKLNLYRLSGLKLGGNVNRHPFFGKVVSAALQHALSLLQHSKQLDR